MITSHTEENFSRALGKSGRQAVIVVLLLLVLEFVGILSCAQAEGEAEDEDEIDDERIMTNLRF